MKNKKNTLKIVIFSIIILLSGIKILFANQEFKVVAKINSEIITNIDVLKEYTYLVTLTSNLKDYKKEQGLSLAKKTLINELIKKNELKKYYDLDKENDYYNKIFKDFYSKLNFKTEVEFETFLNSNELDLDKVRRKIRIESLWNQYIFEKYRAKIVVDENKLEKKVESLIAKKKKERSYNLSEIIITAENKGEYEKKIKAINESIIQNGFKETALIHSESISAKKGGDIGWINESSLSDIINKKIKGLEVNQVSEPIKISNSFIIIKIKNIKSEKLVIDKNQKLKELISKEKNKLLNQYSLTLFNRIKKNQMIKVYE